jgi:hypothetical protein
MTRTVKGVVEGGLIRPLQEHGLPDHKQVLLTITVLPDEAEGAEESCYDLAARLGLIGIAKDTPPDLSTNPRHMEGFGRD